MSSFRPQPQATMEIEIPSTPMRAATLVAPPSYLIDRFLPDCEIIALPPKPTQGGTIRYGVGPLPAPPPPTGIKSRIKRMIQKRTVLPEGSPPVIDFRPFHPGNWAHYIASHLPLYFHICDALGRDWQDVPIVLPVKTPRYIREISTLLGLKTLITDDQLVGEGVLFEMAAHSGPLRRMRPQWVRSPKVWAAVEQVVAHGTADIPRRVFLSRCDTRKISNLAEVEAFLAPYGFVTMCPEQLSPADQFRLFREAETIVAIHGAGMAPLLYRSEDARLRQIVEIQPCGHMADVYREMSELVGCGWIGVRGRIKPEYVAPAYDFSPRGFTGYSLDDFEVDPQALERAFALAQYPIEKKG